MSKELIITISPLGEVTIEACGFIGTECTQVTQQIELALGGGEIKRDPKPEYYATPTVGTESKLTF